MSLGLFPPRLPSRDCSQDGNLGLSKKKSMPKLDLQTTDISRPGTSHSQNNSRSSSPQRQPLGSSHSLPFRLRRHKDGTNQPRRLPVLPVFAPLDLSPSLTTSPIEDSFFSWSSAQSSPVSETSTQTKFSYFQGAKLKAKEVWSKRKHNAAEIDTMLTTREYDMDSPTIPGRPPMPDRQASAPSSASSSPCFGEAKIVTCKKSLTDISPSIMDVKHIHQKPTKVTFNMSPRLACTPEDSPIIDCPPAVPPKETTKPLPLNINKACTGTRPRAGSVPVNTMTRREQDKGAHKKQQASTSRLEEVRQQQIAKGHSQAVERTKPQEIPTKLKRKSTTYRELPRGIRPSEACRVMQAPVVDSLQAAAKKVSQRFGVLSASEVDVLSKELGQLESRCQYLRNTYQSLKTGRRSLHETMLKHLRSERSTGFSQYTLLKQQEALSELDTAIDDWEGKLERAEARREKLKLKLLQHVAAALSVNAQPECSKKRDLATPPKTPEEQQDSKIKVDKLQSITVYALLADVEQEIGRMMTVQE